MNTAFSTWPATRAAGLARLDAFLPRAFRAASSTPPGRSVSTVRALPMSRTVPSTIASCAR